MSKKLRKNERANFKPAVNRQPGYRREAAEQNILIKQTFSKNGKRGLKNNNKKL